MSTVYQLAENVKQYAEIKAQKEKCIESMQRMRMSNRKYERLKQKYAKDQSSEGRAHCRNVVGIDGKTEKSIDAQEKVRSLNSRPIKKLTVLIISCNDVGHMSDRRLKDHWRIGQ
jgi:hypothetical protein